MSTFSGILYYRSHYKIFNIYIKTILEFGSQSRGYEYSRSSSYKFIKSKSNKEEDYTELKHICIDLIKL